MVMYIVIGVGLLIYLIIAWIAGPVLHLNPRDMWILRLALGVLGLIGAAVAVWFLNKRKKAAAANADASGEPGSSDDVELLVREAARRLKSSTLGRGAKLGTLPLVFVLGDPGSTKTTILIHSALDPELLAGQVYRDNDVLPTTAANIWYTRQAIFVDPAGAIMSQPDLWKRLVKLVQPGRISSVGKRAQAPRAALVCFDCESFLQPGASETAISAARRLGVRLQEVSHLLGISFPVYVLFTRLDRIAFFPEFVRGMGKGEAAEVLGATLPLRSGGGGVYAEEETRRLSKAFDEIFYSMAERRLPLLARENEKDKLPAIYEFPRELKKLRTLIVQFLVDLARPSQLSTNPFLRGFYFTGVRPIVVEDVVGATPVAVQAAETNYDAGATRIFSSVGSQLAEAPVAVRAAGSRRVPQWTFLPGLFNDVLVKDRVALSASGSSSRVNLLRRVGLAFAVLLGVVCLAGFGISFYLNHGLETEVQQAVADLHTLQTGPNQVAALGDLQKLDRLRQQLVTLAGYESDGVPWRMRWGLYVGDQIFPDARRVYFDRFRQLLFGDTQNRILEGLRALPEHPGANDNYDTTYNDLKAYLITTSNHEKSTRDFLSPVLMNHWVAGRDIDADRKTLASSQFDFYSTQLTGENPYSSSNSRPTIDQARAFLLQFAGINRYYLQLLNQASQKNNDVGFFDRGQFPDAAGVIASNHRVKGAFTRNGYLFVQEALKNPKSYLSGEEWVLGKGGITEIDPVVLRQKLTELYNHDFVSEWNAVLRSSAVIGYQSYGDADKKLEKLIGPTSPLLELMYFISHNTDPAPAEVKSPFMPVQTVEPPGPPDKLPDHYILDANAEYVKALGKLQTDFHALAQSAGTPDPAQLTAASSSAEGATTSVTQIMTKLPIDSQFANQDQVKRLLEEPIKSAEALLRSGPAQIANGAGKGFCDHFASFSRKYPFDPNSSDDLPVDQLYAVFGPNSDSLKKLSDTIKPYVTKEGSRYVANSTGTLKISPSFLFFYNRVAALSETLYPSGSPPPHFSYTLKQLPSNLDGVEVKIGNETLTGDGTALKTFVWTGAAEDILVSRKGGETLDTFSSPWAAFHFIARGHQLGGGKLEWVIENNGHIVMLAPGKQKSYDYQLQVQGPANPFFDMQGMKCVSQVATATH